MSTTHMDNWNHGRSISDPAPSNAPEKVAKDNAAVRALATCLADPEGIPGSWLHLGPVVKAFWSMNWWIEDISHSLSAFSLSIDKHLKKKKFL